MNHPHESVSDDHPSSPPSLSFCLKNIIALSVADDGLFTSHVPTTATAHQHIVRMIWWSFSQSHHNQRQNWVLKEEIFSLIPSQFNCSYLLYSSTNQLLLSQSINSSVRIDNFCYFSCFSCCNFYLKVDKKLLSSLWLYSNQSVKWSQLSEFIIISSNC